jgi:hypothetical protein
MIFLNFKVHTRGRILGRNPGKSLLSAIHSYLYSLQLCFEISISSKITQLLTYFYSSVTGNLKSENFQDYAQKLQRNYTFVNSASALGNIFYLLVHDELSLTDPSLDVKGEADTPSLLIKCPRDVLIQG